MRKLISQISDLVVLVSVVVLLFTAGRAYFYFNFQQHFNTFTESELLNAFLSGFEYDLKVVLIVNSIFILLFFFPIKIYNSGFYLFILKFLYFTFNLVALFFNMLDVNSFGYNQKRISIVNVKTELLEMFNDFVDFNFSGFIKNYLILLISIIIIIIILRSLLDFIQKRDFEIKSVKQTYFAFVFLLLGFFGWFSYNFVTDNGVWLTNLYRKADRKLAPFVMNNPYMFFSSAACKLPEEMQYWDNAVFQSESSYDSLISAPVKHICLIFIDNIESNTSLNDENITKKVYQFSVLNIGGSTVGKQLNEALLSFPSVFPYEFNQSVYSLNNFESLTQILEKRSFESNLYSIGYQAKQLKLFKNFHGFKNIRMLDSMEQDEPKLISYIIDAFEADTTKKTFDVILIHHISKSVTESIINAYLKEIKNSGLAFIFDIPNNQVEQKVSLIKSIKLYLPNDNITYCPFKQITQLLDIKPSILNYINYHNSFISYGSSIFACGSKTIFASSEPNNFYLLKDSLLLNYCNNETKSLLLLKNRQFLEQDFKDSLAVEKINLEDCIHSIFQDFEYRTETNNLK